MKKKPNPSTDFTKLRGLAEAKYDQSHAQEDPPLTEVDLHRLVHELQVHQIELEMQNEELQQARTEVEAWLERYTDLYDFAPVGYFTLGRNGAICQVNLSGAHLLGVERARLVGRRFGLFVADGDLLGFNTFLEQVFESHDKQACEVMLRKEGNEPFWVQIEAIAVEDGQECRTVVSDIQARKLAEIKLQHMSMHDALTGLYNRSYFEESMEQLELGRHFPISILMADVDHLKITNDRYGHARGDAMLQRVAQVLTIAFRSEDVIARIGGDEFAVLLPDTGAKAAEVAVLRLYDILQEHNTNYFTENPLKLSIGISTAAEYGNSLMETFKEADAKMYHLKQG
jgi:diguanylate cyclase (GGDEF)-like protein/PAS domain S-box-containing protein